MTTIEILSELRSNYNCFDGQEEPIYRALSEAIKAVSAQPEIIRCKDCKHFDIINQPFDMKHCRGFGVMTDDDDFCSRAERRTDEAD